MKDFNNKTAFVTGAASGIGFALTEALLARGAKVMMADVDGPGLENAMAKLGGASDHLSSTLCDVRTMDGVKAAFEQTIETFGNVHFIANNAGVGLAGKTGQFDIKDWQWIVDINLMGVVHGCEIAVPHMLGHGEGGYILNVASMAGHAASGFMAPYHATKFAVVGYSESIVQELTPLGIGVSCLCPTWVQSKIAQSMSGKPSGGWDAADPMAAGTADLVKNGMPAPELAELVLNAVSENQLHIFNDPEMRSAIDERAKLLGKNYDRSLALLEKARLDP